MYMGTNRLAKKARKRNKWAGVGSNVSNMTGLVYQQAGHQGGKEVHGALFGFEGEGRRVKRLLRILCKKRGKGETPRRSINAGDLKRSGCRGGNAAVGAVGGKETQEKKESEVRDFHVSKGGDRGGPTKNDKPDRTD